MINPDSIIVVTGAAGFIGSCMTGFLNAEGFKNFKNVFSGNRVMCK